MANSMNPFDYVNAINYNKKDIMVDDVAEKEYNAYIINKALSFFPDTILYSNEMNKYHHLEPRLQFDFFINIIKKKQRFSKWLKPSEVENLELIKRCYGYSNEKAKSVLTLLSNEQIDELKIRMNKGGRTKSN